MAFKPLNRGGQTLIRTLIEGINIVISTIQNTVVFVILIISADGSVMGTDGMLKYI